MNWAKPLIIFITLIIVAITMMGVFGLSQVSNILNQGNRMKSLPEARMLYKIPANVDKLDPHRIHTAAEANIFRNIYSRLIALSNDGQLQPDLAESFYWDEAAGHYVITMRDGVKTVSGEDITAEDAYLSFMRIIIQEKNTHGNLNSFLCPNVEVSSVEDGCAGMSYKGNVLYLKPSDLSKKTFLIPLLASIDFSIIPKSSIDFSSPDLDVTSYSETTGPYYMTITAEPDQEVRFIANPNHFRFSENMLKEVTLVPLGDEEPTALLESGQVDILPSTIGTKMTDVKGLSETEYSVFRTKNVRLALLMYTERGRKEFTKEQRLSMGLSIKEHILEGLNPANGEETSEFFPMFSEGMLANDQKRALAKLLGKARENRSSDVVRVAVSRAIYKKAKIDLKPLSNVELHQTTKPPWLMPVEEQPHALLGHIDASFYESLSLLHYNFSVGTFGTYEEGVKWLDRYTAIEEKGERLKLLRELHFQMLSDGYFVPLYGSPYVTVARKPFHLEFPEFFAGTPLWLAINK